MLSALTNFRADINRISTVANWLSTPEALASAMLPAAVAIRCGAVVLLSGYFENFIRECMKAFINDLNALGKPITKLTEFKYHHFRNGARVLDRQLKKDRKAQDTSVCEDLAERLASVKASNGYTLLWESFADTRANPGPEVIKDILGAVGVKAPWEKLRSEAPAGVVDMSIFLTSFIEMRNECAHSGATAYPPVASDLIVYGNSLDALATAMTVVLANRMAELKAM